MNDLQHIHTVENAREAVDASEKNPVFVFKHSPNCGVSSTAIHEFESFMAAEAQGFRFYQVDVIDSRAASLELEDAMRVRHESPQVLLMWESECVWHASHRGIRLGELRLQAEALRKKLSL
ncbi:MAG: bacillithiol system redox-active protein YtxJ [Fibrobacterota bacterium]|nr:bacillithiol system redox-active protein YtxJ [Fibrobacterota bacterium]